jgi:hypothetical protein
MQKAVPLSKVTGAACGMNRQVDANELETRSLSVMPIVQLQAPS